MPQAELIAIMSQGDEDGERIIRDMLRIPLIGRFGVLKLDQMNIRGSLINTAFRYANDIHDFVVLALFKDKHMFRCVKVQALMNEDPLMPERARDRLMSSFSEKTDGKTARVLIEGIESVCENPLPEVTNVYILTGRRTDLPHAPLQKFSYNSYGIPSHLKSGMEVLVFNSKTPIPDPSQDITKIMAIYEAGHTGIEAQKLDVPVRYDSTFRL